MKSSKGPAGKGGQANKPAKTPPAALVSRRKAPPATDALGGGATDALGGAAAPGGAKPTLSEFQRDVVADNPISSCVSRFARRARARADALRARARTRFARARARLARGGS